MKNNRYLFNDAEEETVWFSQPFAVQLQTSGNTALNHGAMPYANSNVFVVTGETATQFVGDIYVYDHTLFKPVETKGRHVWKSKKDGSGDEMGNLSYYYDTADIKTLYNFDENENAYMYSENVLREHLVKLKSYEPEERKQMHSELLAVFGSKLVEPATGPQRSSQLTKATLEERARAKRIEEARLGRVLRQNEFDSLKSEIKEIINESDKNGISTKELNELKTVYLPKTELTVEDKEYVEPIINSLKHLNENKISRNAKMSSLSANLAKARTAFDELNKVYVTLPVNSRKSVVISKGKYNPSIFINVNKDGSVGIANTFNNLKKALNKDYIFDESDEHYALDEFLYVTDLLTTKIKEFLNVPVSDSAPKKRLVSDSIVNNITINVTGYIMTTSDTNLDDLKKQLSEVLPYEEKYIKFETEAVNEENVKVLFDILFEWTKEEMTFGELGEYEIELEQILSKFMFDNFSDFDFDVTSNYNN